MNNTSTIESRLKSGEELEFDTYILTEESLYVTKTKQNKVVEEEVCPAIFIEQQYQNIRNNDMYAELKFLVGNRYCSEHIEMSIMATPATWLASKGFLLSSNKVKDVQNYLMVQLKQTPLVKQYADIGFLKNKTNQLLVGLSKPIGEAVNNLVWNQQHSVADISVKGSYETWLQCIKDNVLGEIPLEFILGVGASALLIGYYNQIGFDKDSLMVELVGSSTTGKTTAAQLAISMFGPPIKGRNTLFQSFNGTQNAIPKLLGGNYGVPFLFDELSLSSQGDLTKLVYTIAENREKKRLNETSSFQEQATWATTVLMTGEHSLLQQTNHNLGLYVRLFECNIDAWTKDAAHADKLKQTVQQNYGHVGLAYANHLATNFDCIVEVVETWKTHFQNEIKSDGEKDRIAEKYAMFLAGLQLLGEALEVEFHLHDVADFVLAQEKEMAKDRDIAGMFYEELIQDVCQTSKQFLVDGITNNSYNIKGSISLTKDAKYYRVNYLKPAFQELMQKQNISNEKTLLKNLKRKSFFNHEVDRATKRVMIRDKKSPTYEFFIPVQRLQEWL